ncbi:hypothetical protein PoB_002372900 [Plakobranchus ocellatus]|uniref:SERTA domain-containing protein n=1 Tax=Plakobranchus ocellatus TaxID=259542 RepID=A0AAV3ZTM3_9GAST|nr:hypothetical protein PoB_002372900 [Plakobranchus ocellatus]
MNKGGVGGTVADESALRSAGTLLSRVRAPPPAPWPDGGPESLRSPKNAYLWENPRLIFEHRTLIERAARRRTSLRILAVKQTAERNQTSTSIYRHCCHSGSLSGLCLVLGSRVWTMCRVWEDEEIEAAAEHLQCACPLVSGRE